MTSANVQRVAVILGPTGSGKTSLAMRLNPDRYEVVSCDSRQVYSKMSIGTAAPTQEEQRRIKHHLVQFLPPDQSYSAGRFTEDAKCVFRNIFANHKEPVLIGGTGFYFRSLYSNPFLLPEIDPLIRAKVDSMNPVERVSMLRTLDPDAVARDGDAAVAPLIHPNDGYRVSRALLLLLSGAGRYRELYLDAKSKEHAPDEFEYYGYLIECKKEEYERNLLKRAERMVAEGFAEEAQQVAHEYGESTAALKTLGYPQALLCASGKMSREQLVETLRILHRQYGKRQRTWFKREESLIRIDYDKLALQLDFSGGKID